MFEFNKTIYLIIFLICVYFIYIRNKKHIFWDIQPVTRNSNEQDVKIIKELTQNNTIIEPFPKTLTLEKIEVFNNINSTQTHTFLSKSNTGEEWRQFINKHYMKYTKYSKSYINWILHYPTKHFPSLHILSPDHWNLVLRNSEKSIIGSIRATPTQLSVYGKKFYIFYVDFLCIHKSVRKLRLAPKLISAMVNKGAITPFQSFVFKKENKPLPFQYVSKLNYYILDINEVSFTPDLINIQHYDIHTLDESTLNSTIEKIFTFVNNSAKKYPIHPIFMMKDFKYLFLTRKKVVYSYYIEDKNTKSIIGFVSFLHYKGTFKTNNFYLLELFYGFMNPKFTNYSLEQFVYSLLPKFKKLGYSYILCTNTQDYKYMLDKLGFKKRENLYIHFYNLSAPLTPSSDICFNMP